MKIAISARGNDLDSELDMRLGRAENFLIIDTENESFTILKTNSSQMSHGAGVQTAQALLKAGVKAVISGDCGPKALQVFKAAGVSVYSANVKTVREALEAWRRNELSLLS